MPLKYFHFKLYDYLYWELWTKVSTNRDLDYLWTRSIPQGSISSHLRSLTAAAFTSQPRYSFSLNSHPFSTLRCFQYCLRYHSIKMDALLNSFLHSRAKYRALTLIRLTLQWDHATLSADVYFLEMRVILRHYSKNRKMRTNDACYCCWVVPS